MKLLIVSLFLFTSFSTTNIFASELNIKNDVLDILQHCDALNPVFTYRCNRYKLEDLKKSLDNEAAADEINLINDYLSCYPQNKTTQDTIKNIRLRRLPNNFGRRFTIDVVNCVIEKFNN